MKNIRIFYLEIFPFLVVKFSIYLNRRVFIMTFFRLKLFVFAAIKGAIILNGRGFVICSNYSLLLSLGIASAGGNCTVADKPGVFDDLGQHAAWIKTTMAALNYPYAY